MHFSSTRIRLPPLLTSHRRAGNQSGSNRKLLESSEVVFKECFKRAHIDSISAVGEVLLKDRADSPILRPFRQVYPTGLLDRIKEWLSQVNNRDLVWDSTLNPYRLSTWLVASLIRLTNCHWLIHVGITNNAQSKYCVSLPDNQGKE